MTTYYLVFIKLAFDIFKVDLLLLSRAGLLWSLEVKVK